MILPYSLKNFNNKLFINLKDCILLNLIKIDYNLLFSQTPYLQITKTCHCKLAMLFALLMQLARQILYTGFQESVNGSYIVS